MSGPQPDTEKLVIVQTQPGGYAKTQQYDPIFIAGGTLSSIILTPILGISPLCCCMYKSPENHRASFNLGFAIGMAIYGIAFFGLAAAVRSSIQAMCFTAIYNVATSSFSTADFNKLNSTQKADLNKAVDSACYFYLTYALYAFIAFGFLFTGISGCMCHKSNKILRRTRVGVQLLFFINRAAPLPP
ncbi:hypothetical protein BC830DRAFT_338785 [Chytriomyces sp. MP71]|nr:hypothetical protein BC830DRAFT_338785 [Chytriomyces sp. MP71]